MTNSMSSSSSFDAERIRADFPILDQRIYDDQPLVYLDNAATSQKPRAVIQALVEYYERYNANVHRALHYLGEQATAKYEETRGNVASFIGAEDAHHIVFTRGTTESINLVAYAWGRVHLGPGDVVLATGMEHHSNLVPWQIVCREQGAELKLIPVHEDGTLDMDTFHAWLDPRVKLVAVTHTSNVLGTVNPVRALADAAHRAGALVLVDAAQSVPHRPVNVTELGADVVVFSSHKMCGPTGVGVLWAREDLLASMQPFMGGGEMISRVNDDYSTWADLPYKFEAGTPNIADVIAFGAAVDYVRGLGMEHIHAHDQALTRYAMERLSAIPDVRIFGNAPERGSAVSFEVKGIHPHDLSQYVDQRGIAIRAGHLCAQPLMRRLGVTAVARASFYLYNTPTEVDALAEAVERARGFFGHG
jgi:cysteine desulfurase / selenocysteine lyase